MTVSDNEIIYIDFVKTAQKFRSDAHIMARRENEFVSYFCVSRGR